MAADSRRGGASFKVGLLVLVALAALVAGIFLIGEENRLFVSKSEYRILFANVSGLSTGSPVQLDGVAVGTVRRLVLPTDPSADQIEVTVEVEERYGQRIREGSTARIKTLGLLGDKFVEVTTGAPDTAVIPPGGTIPTASASDIDKLLASGEDAMDNVLRISSSLREILARIENGEGLLGDLTTEGGRSEQLSDELLETLQGVQRVMASLEEGDGLLPRLIHDRQLADRITGSVDRLEAALASLEEGDGLLPALIHDPSTKERFDATLGNLQTLTGELQALAEDLRQGDGLLPRLIHDEEMGDQVLQDLESTLDRVDRLSRDLTEGDGTVARLIRDPSLYEAMEDIIVGIEENRLLRWLIRNRQEKGIEVRYEEAVRGDEAAGEAPPPEDLEDLPEPPDTSSSVDDPPADPPPRPESSDRP